MGEKAGNPTRRQLNIFKRNKTTSNGQEPLIRYPMRRITDNPYTRSTTNKGSPKNRITRHHQDRKNDRNRKDDTSSDSSTSNAANDTSSDEDIEQEDNKTREVTNAKTYTRSRSSNGSTKIPRGRLQQEKERDSNSNGTTSSDSSTSKEDRDTSFDDDSKPEDRRAQEEAHERHKAPESPKGGPCGARRPKETKRGGRNLREVKSAEVNRNDRGRNTEKDGRKENKLLVVKSTPQISGGALAKFCREDKRNNNTQRQAARYPTRTIVATNPYITTVKRKGKNKCDKKKREAERAQEKLNNEKTARGLDPVIEDQISNKAPVIEDPIFNKAPVIEEQISNNNGDDSLGGDVHPGLTHRKLNIKNPYHNDKEKIIDKEAEEIKGRGYGTRYQQATIGFPRDKKRPKPLQQNTGPTPDDDEDHKRKENMHWGDNMTAKLDKKCIRTYFQNINGL